MTLRFEGALDESAVARVRAAANTPAAAFRLDLEGADDPAPAALAALVDTLDAVRAAGKRVVLVAPPAGRLRDGALALERPREEPYAG